MEPLAVAGLLFLAAVVSWWRLSRGGQPPRLRPGDVAGPSPRVSVIVPARNEAANVERVLASLSRLEGVAFEVLLVDGDSSDGTRARAEAFAAQDARVRVVAEPPLPEGWVGKSWAAWTGRRAASDPDWLLFTDADTVHAPWSLRAAVDAACGVDAVFLTGLTRQSLGSWAERVCMPAVFTLILAAAGGPGHRRIGDPEHAIANGQYLLVRADAYDDLGGHAAVRGHIAEDLALARRAARAGVRAVFVDLTDAVSVRMYRGLGDMFRGWRKNVASGAAETPPAAFVTTLLTATVGLGAAPSAVGFAAVGAWLAAGVAVAAAGVAAFTVQRASGVLAGWSRGWPGVVFHPVGYAFFIGVLAASAWDRWSGRGPVWKGRRYAPR